MRTAVLLVAAALACSGCQTRFSQDEKILAWNGVLVQGSKVMVTHAYPGVYPSETLAYANSDLEWKVKEVTGDQRADCFLVPRIGGYDVTILSRKRISEQQSELMRSHVEAALEKAWKETEIYRNKE